jgi:ribonuclease T2
MRAVLSVVAAVWLMLAGPVQADGEKAGVFDYYVLSLSWSPTWCAIEGDGRDARQCDRGRKVGWTLHGLWPQFENGWPSFCRTGQRDPSRAQTGAMADIMGSGGLAWHQWKKHGRCSGLSAQAYLELSRQAYNAVTRPPVLRKTTKDIKVPAKLIEDAWILANPVLERNQITVTCRDRRIQEVRICLTKDMEPRKCGADVIRDCRMEDALFSPIR